MLTLDSVSVDDHIFKLTIVLKCRYKKKTTIEHFNRNKYIKCIEFKTKFIRLGSRY